MIRYMLMISYIRGQNSRHMNPFEIERGESFIIGDSDLRELLDRPYKSGYGMILFCYKGTANISVDLSRWDIRRNTVIVLIPDTRRSGGDHKCDHPAVLADLHGSE